MTASITVDGGGSRCRARLRRDTGACEATLEEPLNIAGQPVDKVLDRLDRLLDGLPAAVPIDSVSVGVAGGVPGKRRDIVQEAIEHRFPEAEVVVGRDLDLIVTQLCGQGIAVVVGTGCAAVATTADGTQVTVDGHGPVIGDRGGGAWIGLRAVQAGLRRFDLEGAEPPLLGALCESLGLRGSRGLLTALSDDAGLSACRLAALAPTVLALADQRDPDASAIVTSAVAEVAATVGAAAVRAVQPLPANVAIAGGLGSASALLTPLRSSLLRSGAAKRVDPVDPLDADLVAHGLDRSN
jgi:glucosamine kinase